MNRLKQSGHRFATYFCVKMEIFGENQIYFYILGIFLTVVALIVSTKYTFTNIKRIWDAGKPDKVVADEKENIPGIIAKDELVNSPAGGDNAGRDPMCEDDLEVDPVQYCEHIQSEVKKAKHRVAERQVKQNMSADEMQAERELQRRQLEQIFKLMQQNDDKFGASSMEDVKQQMKLYA